jgi:hypothetical protein
METDLHPILLHNNSRLHVHPWYSEQFISDSLINYLKGNGYRIHKDVYTKMPKKPETIITASKFFTKEIIEVKGLPLDVQKGSPQKETPKNTSHVHHTKSWFSEALLNSLMNFGNYYAIDNAEVAMALPNVEKYKAIIEKVQDYFALNNLYFKIYLINQDGSVDVSNLNIKYIKDNV